MYFSSSAGGAFHIWRQRFPEGVPDQITSGPSEEEGIAIAARERPDLVLMDIRLKGEKDGIRAAEEILEQVDASIVYLTAHSDPLTVDRASHTDHDGFSLKPFHRRELQSTIAVAMLRRAIKAREKEQ
jgi:DNA-binding NarL/FixJ family response regulator